MPFQLKPSDSGYPDLLQNIHDPPPHLWGEGDPKFLSDGTRLAIVGARECTPYGVKVAFDLAREAVKAGLVVVSGLAYGIDTAAHRGALEGGGKTVAVLGCGIDIPYPAENLELKRRIAQSGAVITEFSPGTRATAWSFPQRNRIISGLSRGVVVVEAGEKSGSLITADFALQQGREVFAVPGNIDSPKSVGTNRLIQSGAKLVSGIGEILEEFRWIVPPLASRRMEASGATKEETVLLRLLAEGPCLMEELLQGSGLPVERLSTLLVEMEIGGRIKSLPGSRFQLR